MAEEDDSVESKSSSLGLISDILSSFTAIGTSTSAPDEAQNSDHTDTEQVEELQENLSTDTDYTDVKLEGVMDDDSNGEQRQSSLEKITEFLASFTSGSSELTEEPSADGEKYDEDQNDSSSQDSYGSSNENNSKADLRETTGDEMHRQSSLEKISDFLSSFTSLANSSTEAIDDNNKTNDNIDKSPQKDEQLVNEDVILEDNESDEPISSEFRARSSSSRIFTEPETIDKKDLDYVTLVSS